MTHLFLKNRLDLGRQLDQLVQSVRSRQKYRLIPKNQKDL
jgi:hypothetical protein